MKYDIKDFEKIVSGEVEIEEVTKKYNVSQSRLQRVMNYYGFYVHKTKFKITTPHKTKVVYSYLSCASELNVSVETIRKAVKGERIKVFEEMGIKVEVVK